MKPLILAVTLWTTVAALGGLYGISTAGANPCSTLAFCQLQ